VSCANFLVQATAMAILATTNDAWVLFLGCVLFGLGVGNVVSLPGLIVQREFPREHFSRIVSLVVAINQFSFAFGPSLLGEFEYLSGGYGAALVACLAMQVIAAVLVVVLRGRPRHG
jgi:MFS family permease